MEFTLTFIKLFVFGLGLAAPLLIFLVLFIILLGQVVGARECWSRFDSLYWSLITATTVGYGDIRPMAIISKVLSVLIALIGIIFTGIMVALAINAATVAFNQSNDADVMKTNVEKTR